MADPRDHSAWLYHMRVIDHIRAQGEARPILGQGASADPAFYTTPGPPPNNTGQVPQYPGPPLQFPNMPPQQNGPPPQQYHQLQQQQQQYPGLQQPQQQQPPQPRLQYQHEQQHYPVQPQQPQSQPPQQYQHEQQHYPGQQQEQQYPGAPPTFQETAIPPQYAGPPSQPNYNGQAQSYPFATAPTQQNPNYTMQPPQTNYTNQPPPQQFSAAQEKQFAHPAKSQIANPPQPPAVGPPNPVHKSSLNAYASEFVPRKLWHLKQDLSPQNEPEPSYADNNYQEVAYSVEDPVPIFNGAMTVLNSDPGKLFDEKIAGRLRDTLKRILTSETINTFVEAVVEKGISDSNMRSMVAQLSAYLAAHLTEQYSNGTFRQYFLKRLHMEHEKREETAADPGNSHRVQGFTEFLAELLLYLKTASGEPYGVLGHAVHDQMRLLMKIWHANQGQFVLGNFRQLNCVIWSLKICGYVLEDIEKNEGKGTPKMDSLIQSLKDIIVDEANQRRLRRMLLSIVEMRAENWGRKAFATKPQNSLPPDQVADPQSEDAQDQENDQEDDLDATEQNQLQDFIDNLLRSDSEVSEPPSPSVGTWSTNDGD